MSKQENRTNAAVLYADARHISLLQSTANQSEERGEEESEGLNHDLNSLSLSYTQDKVGVVFT